MSEIGVVGRETFTLGFRLAGVRRIWNADDGPALERAVAEVRRDDQISILVMETSDLERVDRRLRDVLVASVKPTLVAVGTDEDNTLRDKIKQAVGVDLW